MFSQKCHVIVSEIVPTRYAHFIKWQSTHVQSYRTELGHEGVQMAQRSEVTLSKGPRFQVSKGLLTVLISTVVLFILSAVIAPTSVSPGPLGSMIPFAAILAIVGLGQMLVIQQAGIDLSVPGSVSLAAVIVSALPEIEDDRLLSAVILSLVVAIAIGAFNGFLVGFLKLNPIIATLGTNSLLFGFVMLITQGIPRMTTALLLSVVSGSTFGIPNSVFFATAVLLIVIFVLRKTVPGRRFESIGASAPVAMVSGLRIKTHQAMAYVWAQVLYAIAGIMIAGVISEPNGSMGSAYLLPSVAVVVLGGTSLLGGRGLPTATVIAAVFLSQLDQFVLALGVNFAIRTLVQAAALAIGVAIYTVDWSRVRSLLQKFLSTQRRGEHQTSLPTA
jgi:ribose transport system permease protein